MPIMLIPTLVAALALAAGREDDAAAAHAGDGEQAELIRWQAYLDDDSRELPALPGPSSACSVRVLSTALHYRRNPDQYRDAFFSALTIDDYAERAAGRYEMVSPDVLTTTLSEATKPADGVTDQRVGAVVGFCRLKDRNLWMATEKYGRVSLARFLRGMAVSTLLEGTDEDGLAIVNAVDAQAAAEHGARQP